MIDGTDPDALKNWLTHAAWPLWLEHGIDRHAGGFHEALDPAGYVCHAPFRRLRVLTRQTYVFAAAHRAGFPQADAAVALGIDYLARHAALPEGGYAWRFDLQNRAIDTTRDLYDHAFVLLALSSAAGILPAPNLRRLALALLAHLDRAFAHPAGGYRESLPDTSGQPRRQNPHMHLLEALLAAHEAFGDPIFLTRAQILAELFLRHFLVDGAVAEFFDDTLTPHRRGGTFLTEPGHHYEWVWLLDWLQHHTGPQPALAAASAALIGFVDRHGIHPTTGDLVETVSSDGQVTPTARLWPQTERLKVRPEASTLAAWLEPDGLWHERRDILGAFVLQPSAATSLYHLTSAITHQSKAGGRAPPRTPALL